MRLMVFVTDDGTADGTGPLLFLRERPDAVLPKNPRALEWRYFATIDENDRLLGDDPVAIERIAANGYYIANRLIRT